MAQARPDIILINPGNWTAVYGQVGGLYGISPPLGIGMIASFVRQNGFSVEIIDAQALNISPEDVSKIIAEKQPLAAGVSAFTPQMTAAAEILSFIKKNAPGVKTLIGGHHSAALPRKTMEETDADFLCSCEGFLPTLNLLRLLKENPRRVDFQVEGLWHKNPNGIFPNPAAPLFKNLDELPFTAWDLLPMEVYRAHNWHAFGYDSRSPYAVMFTSLGCPFSCTYCSVNAVYGRHSYRVRSPEHFCAEVDHLASAYGVRHVEIVDDTFTIDKERVHRICDILIERGHAINFWAYARTDTVDSALLKKMKRAGINWVCYGFESGNERVRDSVNKRQSTISEAIAMTREAGIKILANFMFGLPEDDEESMRETLALAKRINAEYANFYSVMAYPGSKLYEEAVEQGWRLPDVWHGYSQYAYETLPLQTRRLSGPQVLTFRDKAFKEYFSNPAYQEMVREAFGQKIVDSIRGMLTKQLKRKYIETPPAEEAIQ